MKTNRVLRYRWTLGTLARVINLYQAWGKSEKPAEYRALLAKDEK